MKYIIHEVRPGYHWRISTESRVPALVLADENENMGRPHEDGEPCVLCDKWRKEASDAKKV